VLQGKFDGRGDGVAQGAIVDTPAGDWYAIMFQDHGAVGRIPTIQPVEWVDGWPVMGDNTVPMKTVRVNLPASGEDYVWASDEFDSGKLALVWQWNHKPDDGGWSLSERPGWMRIYASEPVEDIAYARNSLTQRTVGPKSEASVKVDVSSLKPGDRAGICAFQSHNFAIGVEVNADGDRDVVLRTNSPKEKDVEVYRAPLASDELYLKIDYVFTPSEGDIAEADTATASWSADGRNWTDCGYTLKMLYTLDYFTGYRTALYCYTSSEDSSGYADFDWFHQSVK
jgi:beta-xylosidase